MVVRHVRVAAAAPLSPTVLMAGSRMSRSGLEENCEYQRSEQISVIAQSAVGIPESSARVLTLPLVASSERLSIGVAHVGVDTFFGHRNWVS